MSGSSGRAFLILSFLVSCGRNLLILGRYSHFTFVKTGLRACLIKELSWLLLPVHFPQQKSIKQSLLQNPIIYLMVVVCAYRSTPPRVSALTGEQFFQPGIFPRYPFSIAPEIIQLFPEKTFINSHN